MKTSLRKGFIAKWHKAWMWKHFQGTISGAIFIFSFVEEAPYFCKLVGIFCTALSIVVVIYTHTLDLFVPFVSCFLTLWLNLNNLFLWQKFLRSQDSMCSLFVIFHWFFFAPRLLTKQLAFSCFLIIVEYMAVS